MDFSDLTDTEFDFRCDFSGDACDYWDYDFLIEQFDEKHLINLSSIEVKQLRENCRRILAAVDSVQGGL